MRDRHAIPFAERTISFASAATAAIAVAVFAALATGCEPRLFTYEKEYVVSLELDLNTQERLELTFDKITDYTFPDCPWKKEGLAFDGWKVVLNNSSDGSALYKPGERVTVSRNMRFTTKWTGMYRVRYLSNGVSSPDMPVDDTKYRAGQSTVVPEYSWKNEVGDDDSGYYFGGWNTAADGTGTVYLPGMKLAVWADVALYAQWKPLYRVWYAQETGVGAERVLGGTYLPNEQIVVNGMLFSSPPESGMLFIGWSLNPLGTGTCYLEGDKFEFTITDMGRDVGVAFYDVTFYPVWL